MYQSIINGWKFGLDVYSYMTEIREKGLKAMGLPEKCEELEQRYYKLNKLEEIIFPIARFLRNPLGDLKNDIYIMEHPGH